MTKWYLLYDPGFLAGVVVILGALGLVLHRIWVALAGGRRAWLLGTRHGATMYRDARTTWPFSLACIAVALLMLAGTLVLELFDRDAARETLWWLSGLPWVAAAGALLWWPTWLGPRWYRRWVTSPEAPYTNPWTPAEILDVQQTRPGRAREVALRDIERCRELLAAPR